MGRDARVWRDRHGRGARSLPRADGFDRALTAALHAMDTVYPTAMPGITVRVADYPTTTDLDLAGDHVPTSRVVRTVPPECTIFRHPLVDRANSQPDLQSAVRHALRAAVEQALSTRRPE